MPETRSAELLWRTEPRPRPGPKAALSVDAIARAAIAIADTEGLGAISMKRVAESFGFTTMSLYRYVPGKTELVDLMFDTAMGAPPDLESMPGRWRPRLEGWARQMWLLILEHPWALDVLARLRVPGPNELAWMECGVRILADTKLTGPDRLDALFVVVGQVRIAAQYAVIGAQPREGLTTEQWASGVRTVLRAHSSAFPALTSAVTAGAFDSGNDPLDFGLDCVLNGIELLANRRIPSEGRS